MDTLVALPDTTSQPDKCFLEALRLRHLQHLETPEAIPSPPSSPGRKAGHYDPTQTSISPGPVPTSPAPTRGIFFCNDDPPRTTATTKPTAVCCHYCHNPTTTTTTTTTTVTTRSPRCNSTTTTTNRTNALLNTYTAFLTSHRTALVQILHLTHAAPGATTTTTAAES